MKKPLIYIVLVLSTIFWGISFIMTKELFLSEEHITVTILITLRLAIASLVMVPVLLLTGHMERVRKEDLKWFLLLALCEPFIYNLCETSGVQLVSGSLASVIVATIPLFVPFGMWLGYRKRIHLPLLIGVVLSLVGVAIMLIGGDGLTGNAKGLLFLSGAVFIAVVYTLILVKIVDHYNSVTITTYQNLIGLIYYLPLMLLTDGSRLSLLSWSPKMLLLLLTLGICCSTLAYVFYNIGVRRLGASEACIFNNAIPVFSLIAAVLIGQETFSWLKVAGIVIVISGVAIAQYQPRGTSGNP
ncbi:MAG: DMT family transporter [Bacteroidales bacterium]|nr:DMT family transporter [Bacteroidales bacterium]